MAGRSFRKDAGTYTNDLVYVDASFAIGAAGAVGAIRPSVDSGIASVVKTGGPTGVYTVTLSDGFFYALTKYVELEDLAAGGDGRYATSSPVTNEGAGGGGMAPNPNPMSFLVYTRNAGGALTDFTSGKVQLTLALKNTKTGA